MKDVNLFLDMDGVMAKWQEDKTFEEVAMPGYFATLPVVENIVEAIKMIHKNNKIKALNVNIHLKILSATFDDNHSRKDKRQWLKEKLPFIKEKDICFVNVGEDKAQCIDKKRHNFLLDDKSSNLFAFEKAGGIGIKCYNHCNGTKGTWNGYNIRNTMTAEKIATQLYGIILAHISVAA